ncbi:MAG: ABC-three component system protein [Sulfurifustis sp.]
MSSDSSPSTQTDSAVPGSIAGVIFQIERALFWLVESSANAIVGIETEGDIYTKEVGSADIHEEDKHSIQSAGHPFTDRGEALWKTLRIWGRAEKKREHSGRDVRLLLVTNRPVPDGCLARRLAQAKVPAEIAACINEIRAISVKSESVSKLVNEVQSFDDATLDAVIKRIELYDADAGVAHDVLRKKIISRLHIAPGINGDDVVQTLTGWMVECLISKWRAGQPGWIERTSLDTRYHRCLIEMRGARVRARAERLVSVDPQERQKHKSRRFVEHLARIAVEPELVDEAIDDFLRFSTEYYRLVEEGDVSKQHWETRGDRLKNRWRDVLRQRIKDLRHRNAEDVGQLIYYDTLNHREPLADYDQPEPYLTKGHYHRLADEDHVWWYPDIRLTY